MNSNKKKNIYMIMIILVLLIFIPIQTEAKTKDYSIKKITSEKYSNRWGIKKISKNELNILAQIVYLEAGNQGDKGEQAVIETIFNRVAHKKYPNKIVKVLSQRGQFSTWRKRSRAKNGTKELKNIYKVLKGETKLLSKKTVYFSVRPRNRKIELHYKNHYFCRY